MSVQSSDVSVDVVVDFRLRAKIPPGFLMGISGSSDELGSWDPLKAKVMKRSKFSDQEWHREITLKRSNQHYYRFFLCKPLRDPSMRQRSPEYTDVDLSQQQGLVIYKWDSQQHSRCVNISEMHHYCILPMVDFGGVTDHQHTFCSEWLVNVSEIRMRLLGDCPVKFYKDGIRNEPVGIKCCPIDCTDLMKSCLPKTSKLGPATTNDAMLLRFLMVSAIPVSAFQKLIGPHGISKTLGPQTQSLLAVDINTLELSGSGTYEQVGLLENQIATFRWGQFLSFCIYTIIQETLGFRFEFYREMVGNMTFFGTAFLLPIEQGLSCKVIRTPIFGTDTSCIGQMTLDCLVVKPTPNLKLDMKVSQEYLWKHKGHPGYYTASDGISDYHMKQILALKENTMASFTVAIKRGVHFIEFDVQLCKDKVPVIYHDFHLLVPSFKPFCKKSEVHEIGVKDLSLSTLQSAKLNKYSEKPSDDVGYIDHEPFPTMRTALRSIDASLGFIINVKYPQRLDNGRLEMDDYFDHNTVTDTIITTVVTCQFTRKIIFSSDNADICTLLKKKQNKFPVLYRSKAVNPHYPIYNDFRSKSFDAAIQFAISEKLLGVHFLAEELLTDLRMIKKAHLLGLVVFAWSDKKDINKEIRQSRVDAAVVDNIHFNLERGLWREVFHLFKQEKGVDFLKTHVMTGIKRSTH